MPPALPAEVHARAKALQRRARLQDVDLIRVLAGRCLVREATV
jgi:hypothetical protein